MTDPAMRERERIVAWLRDMKRTETNWPQHIALRIERGDHHTTHAQGGE